MKRVMENFVEVETTKEYDGYYYQVAEVISIVVLGSLCGLKNMKRKRRGGVIRKKPDRETASAVAEPAVPP